jgi:glycolate oxidase FAD binding subunit
LPPAAKYPAFDGDWLTEWGGALRWFRTDAACEQVDLAARGLGGYAAEFREPTTPQQFDKGALKFYRRLKDAFDPKAIFNRGRLFQEIGQEADEAAR